MSFEQRTLNAIRTRLAERGVSLSVDLSFEAETVPPAPQDGFVAAVTAIDEQGRAVNSLLARMTVAGPLRFEGHVTESLGRRFADAIAASDAYAPYRTIAAETVA